MASTRELLILASASSARAALLRAAGISFTVDPPAIDEAALKLECRDRGLDAGSCAMLLAEAKARVVARRYPEALVIGADQILVAGDEWFDKPADLDQAATHLRRLRGREHSLATAVCVMRGGTRLWGTITTPRLTMRRFSEAFLADYIAAEGDSILSSVGAYRIEGRGMQLFARIEGDHFSVLGLPLLELLEFLRAEGVLEE
jgi:septum formation protein